MTDNSLKTERRSFLKLAILFEGGMLIAAIAIGWLVGNPVWSKVHLTLDSLTGGLVLTIPMLAFLAYASCSRQKKFVEIRQLLQRVIGKPLSTCRFPDLFLLALLAGVSEEFLFRGIVEPWLGRWGSVTAVIATSLLFGFCHAVTPTYFFLAALLGAYLSLTMRWSNPPSLFIPIFCHSAYDLVAFFVVRQSFLRGMEQVSHQMADAEN